MNTTNNELTKATGRDSDHAHEGEPQTVQAGTCRACGRDLVQTSERTYHPAAVMSTDEPCPDLIPIPGTEYFSLDVPAESFIAEAVSR